MDSVDGGGTDLEERVIKHNMKHHKIMSILLGGCGIFMILLVWEYYSVRMHMEKLHVLQDQYYGYIDSVQRIVRTKKPYPRCATNQDDCTVDRTPDYLKESAISYFKEQDLDELLSRIDECDMPDDQLLIADRDDTRSEIAQLPDKAECAIPQWAQTAQRDSETGITFACPLDRSRFWLSSLFGARKKPNGQTGFHRGIDMAAQRGTDVHAAATGIVEYAGYAPGYGNTIVIVHDAVYKTRYAHLDEVHVCTNQKVEQGAMIGAVGDTGFTIKRGNDASHLHFELYEWGEQVNPLALITL